MESAVDAHSSGDREECLLLTTVGEDYTVHQRQRESPSDVSLCPVLKLSDVSRASSCW